MGRRDRDADGQPHSDDEPAAPLLQLTGIGKSFARVAALEDISAVDLRAGEIHAIVGENGAGKSTLVKIIAGAYTPDTGTITLRGRQFDHLTPHLARQHGIAVVHQEFNLLPDLSIAENILVGNLPGGRFGTVRPAKIRSAASAILSRLGSSLDPKRLVADLTVAEQQLVEVAKALAVDARIIVMDEPSTVLSNEELESLYKVLRKLRAERRGIVYISHRLGEVFALADRVTVLKDGRHVSTSNVSDVDEGELVRRMVGRPLVQMFPQRIAKMSQQILDIVNVTVPGKIFDISLSLRRGEILGVAGLGGSGRTTLARSLVGLEKVSSGNFTMDDRRLPRSPRGCARAGLVMIPEDRKAHGIIAGQSVARNLSLASLRDLRRLQVLSLRRERDFASRLVTQFDVRTPGLSKGIQFLSGGNQQKVVLARWLVRAPRVVVLDEPTRGVDVGAKAEIYKIIEELSEDGVGVLVASSDLPELLGMCDRIVVMYEGRIVGETVRGEATEERIVHLASGGSPPDEAFEMDAIAGSEWGLTR